MRLSARRLTGPVRLTARRLVARRPRGDSGTVLLLIVCYTVIAAVLIVAGADASAVFLARRGLGATADGAALDAAQALDRARYYGAAAAPVGGGPTLTDSTVQAAVAGYLTDAGAASSFPGLAWSAGTPDGRTAQVWLSTRVRLPFAAWLLPGSAAQVTVTVTADATAPGR